MTIYGKVGTFTRDEERAGVPGHGPVVLSGAVKANDGTYPTGLFLTRKSGELIPLAEVADEVIETGDGNTKAFTGTLANYPVEPGTVVATDGVETFTDDGSGNLVGSAGGTGTINYKTGAYSMTFNANVGNGTDVTADYITDFAGVLEEQVDTTASGSCLYVAHGTVDTTCLKVGKTVKAEPSASLLLLMQAKGVYTYGVFGNASHGTGVLGQGSDNDFHANGCGIIRFKAVTLPAASSAYQGCLANNGTQLHECGYDSGLSTWRWVPFTNFTSA